MLLPPALALSTLLTLLPVLYVACATPFLVVFDVRHRRLPNLIVLPGVAVTALAVAAGALWAHVDAARPALVTGVTLLMFAAFRAAGALGSGDVKLAVLLAAALAPLAGADPALYALAGSTAAIAAGLASLPLLARTRLARNHSAAISGAGAPADGDVAAAVIPLGPFLLLGFWVAVAAAFLCSVA